MGDIVSVGASLLGGGQQDTPAVPDYMALARQQNQANRINTTTPYGTVTYTSGKDLYQSDLGKYNAYVKQLKDAQTAAKAVTSTYNKTNSALKKQLSKTKDPAQKASLQSQIEANKQKYTTDLAAANQSVTDLQANAIAKPDSTSYQYSPDKWTAEQKLSPEQQNILNAQQKSTQGALDAANLGLGNIEAAMKQGSVDMSKLPQMVSKVDTSGMPDIQSSINTANLPGLMSDINTANLNPLQSSINTSNLPSYGINPGETYSDAIMRRLQPQMAQQKQAFDTQMANRGIVPGSVAYNNAYRNFQQGQNDMLTSAVVQGMNTGLSANQQQFGQNAAQAALANAVNQQQFGQNQDIFNARNAANQQQFNQNAAQAGLANTARSQLFGEGLSNAQLANQTNQQAYNQAQTNLLTPLNMFNSLRTGSEVTNPQPAQTTSSADYGAAGANQYNANVGQANAQNAANTNFYGGLMNIGQSIGNIFNPNSNAGRINL